MTSTLSNPTGTERAGLDYAGQLLTRGEPERAAEYLGRLLAESPGLAQGHYLLGVALEQLGRSEAAEAELRAALNGDPAHARAAVALSEILARTDRVAEARQLLQPFAAQPDANIFVLTAAAVASRSLRRFDEAVDLYTRARDAAPASGVAEHNLASVLNDLQRYPQAEEAAGRAFAKGLDAPEAWLVRARALQGLGRMDEAADAYAEAIRRRPTYAEAHGELTQLVWMRSEDGPTASRLLDAAIREHPEHAGLRLKRAGLAEYAESPEAAYHVLADTPPSVRDTPMVRAFAAQFATRFDPELAMREAEAAYAAAPAEQAVISSLCQAQLALGDAADAARTAAILRERWRLNQQGIALLATAWRMMGDERYHQLYDYDRLVRAWQIDTPAGWSDLDGFLADLAEALHRSHRFRAHPLGQSLRHGSQSEIGPGSDEPAIRGLFQALEGPIRRHIAELGAGEDPLRARIAAGHQYNGAWSVRLRGGGYHADHIHPMGWLSSACYIALPEAISRGREGWIRFGEPGIATAEPLQAEHFVRPEPGRLVLFPSYMWHGTVPFSGEDPRLTVAFDVIPS